MKQAAPGWIPGFASLVLQFVFTLGIESGYLKNKRLDEINSSRRSLYFIRFDNLVTRLHQYPIHCLNRWWQFCLTQHLTKVYLNDTTQREHRNIITKSFKWIFRIITYQFHT